MILTDSDSDSAKYRATGHTTHRSDARYVRTNVCIMYHYVSCITYHRSSIIATGILQIYFSFLFSFSFSFSFRFSFFVVFLSDSEQILSYLVIYRILYLTLMSEEPREQQRSALTGLQAL